MMEEETSLSPQLAMLLPIAMVLWVRVTDLSTINISNTKIKSIIANFQEEVEGHPVEIVTQMVMKME
jgi:hypothetical protein